MFAIVVRFAFGKSSAVQRRLERSSRVEQEISAKIDARFEGIVAVPKFERCIRLQRFVQTPCHRLSNLDPHRLLLVRRRPVPSQAEELDYVHVIVVQVLASFEPAERIPLIFYRQHDLDDLWSIGHRLRGSLCQQEYQERQIGRRSLLQVSSS